MTPSVQSQRRLRLELILGLGATVLAMWLHWQFWAHAGGLWRDEAGYAGLAGLPTWRDVWLMLAHDHSPMLMPAVIRLWGGADWGQTDWGLRILGMGCGLLLLASFWIACWCLRRGGPLLPLALVALNGLVVRASDSLRAYGLGSALNVLTLALIWRGVQKPQRSNLVLAGVAAVLSVQCLYQNAFFVLAACSGGIVVCARARRWRDAAWILGIGLAAAVSLLPYVGLIIHSQSWWVLQKEGVSAGDAWESASQILGFPWSWCNWGWGGLCVLAGLLAWKLVDSKAGGDEVNLFCGVALWVGIGGFCIFLKLAAIPPPYWYYLPVLAFAAVCLDVQLCCSGRWRAPVFCALILLAGLAAGRNSWPMLSSPQTNMDKAVAIIVRHAAKEDFIIVYPWFYGVGFNRYYHGSTPWTTVPPVADHEFHRYDMVKSRMLEAQPLQPVFDHLEATLQAGHRVWFLNGPVVGPSPQSLGLAPDPKYGWNETIYARVWGKQLRRELAMQADQSLVLINPMSIPEKPFEKAGVVVFFR